MARKDFIGNALAVAQVDKLTPANVSVGSVFTYTINRHAVSYTAAANTVADAVTGFVAAWNASTIPEFAEVTASAGPGNAYVVLTADAPGLSFGGASSTSGSGSPTFAKVSLIANAAPWDWSSAGNWMTDGDITVGGAPITGDSVVISGEMPILEGLDQSAVTLSLLVVTDGYTKDIGLRRWRENSPSGQTYREYRQRALKIGASVVIYGSSDNLSPAGVLPSFAKLHLVGDSNVSIFGTGQPFVQGGYALELSGGGSATTVGITHGNLFLSPSLDEPMELAVLIMGQDATANSRIPEVKCGSATTLGAIVKHGGTLRTNCGYDAAIQYKGEWVHRSGTEGTCSLADGAYRSYSDSTPDTMNVWPKAVVDWNGLPVARTVNTVNFFGCGAYPPVWLDNTHNVTITTTNYPLGV